MGDRGRQGCVLLNAFDDEVMIHRRVLPLARMGLQWRRSISYAKQ